MTSRFWPLCAWCFSRKRFHSYRFGEIVFYTVCNKQYVILPNYEQDYLRRTSPVSRSCRETETADVIRQMSEFQVCRYSETEAGWEPITQQHELGESHPQLSHYTLHFVVRNLVGITKRNGDITYREQCPQGCGTVVSWSTQPASPPQHTPTHTCTGEGLQYE